MDVLPVPSLSSSLLHTVLFLGVSVSSLFPGELAVSDPCNPGLVRTSVILGMLVWFPVVGVVLFVECFFRRGLVNGFVVC